MNVFADANSWDGDDFRLFGDEHLLALTLVVLVQLLFFDRFKDASEATKRTIRQAMGGALFAQELSYHAWRLYTHNWTPAEMLPLHACSVSVWLGGLMLLTRNYRLYEHCYFLGIVGAVCALATPDIGRFGFPHYRFFQFFASHALILAAPLWLTVAEGFRPRPRSLVKAITGTAVHAAGAYLVNRRLGSNYMFVNRKPATQSSLDKLPPWPGYLPIIAGVVLAAYGALYAPWALRDAARGPL